jgi:tRNA threonylcarbamoyl adenosine modification protein YeaZ
MGHVRTLALDTSSPAGSIAVLCENECLGMVSTRSDEAYSSRFFRQLQFLLDELKLALNKFDLFAVCTGPGSFTGLRVGLTAVKGWSEVYGKPIAALSGLEAVAAQSRCGAKMVIPVLDARRGQVYFGKYRRQGGAEPNGSVLDAQASDVWTAQQNERVATPEEFFKELTGWKPDPEALESVVIATPDPTLLAGKFAEFRALSAWARSVQVEQVSAVLAPHIGRLGILHAKQGHLTDALSLDANYVRRSDAELNWKPPAGL